jgi:nitroimidazol reductase NimA-like FMN-containing flavoprotein (pyridoxamine 5'-phosphate oxidase superfamily)
VRKKLSKMEKAFINKARVARVASIDPRGSVHAAPFCHAFDEARRAIYVFTDAGGTTARNLRSRPTASIVCDDYFEDWERIRGVVVHARARTVIGPELKQASRLLKRKYRQYRAYDIDYVIALDVTAVTSWGL